MSGTSFAASNQSAFPVIEQIVEKYDPKEKHKVTAQWYGYRAKEDITALPAGFLVSPSQNVLTNAAGLIYSRPGYSLYGAAASTQFVPDGIRSHYDWETHLGFEQHLREHTGILEWCYVDSSGNVSWLPLMTANTMPVWVQGSNFFRYTEYWNSTELVDELLFVNGDGSVYRWNGALAKVASVTSSALSAAPFITQPAAAITLVGPPGTTLSGSTTTAGNSVVSGTMTVAGQSVPVAIILLPNTPAANDTITLNVNGTPIVSTFISSPYQPPWYSGAASGSIAIGYNYTTYGSGASQVKIPNSVNASQTKANYLSFLQNPGVFKSAFYIGNTSYANTLGTLTISANPLVSGSTTTAGNTFSASADLHNLTFAMVNNPASGDTATFTVQGQAVQVQFVNTIGAVAGNVLIGVNAAATMTNLLGLLQNPATTNTTQVAFSSTNQLIIALFNYAVSTGITLQGQKSWAQMGFYTSTGGRSVIINGSVFNYTGGESGQTITGVTPDPTTAVTINYGDPVVQAPMFCPVSSVSSLPSSYNPNLIATLNNQVWYGNTLRRDVYFSKVNNFADVSASSPRQPAEGSGSNGISLDAACTGFAPQETDMYIFAGPDWIYDVSVASQTTDVVSGVTIAYEPISTKSLKISPGQGAISQEAIFKVKNSVMFITNEPAIDDLGRVASNLELPESITITDSIKNDFFNYDLTGAFGFYAKYFLYIVLPAEQRMLIYNFARGWWESPQVFSFSRLAWINGQLYAHSNSVPETYRLFLDNPLDPNVVYNDNGNPINCLAYFSYQNFGMRGTRKLFGELYVEGYMTTNTTLYCGTKYDFGGFSGEQTYTIPGNNQSFLVYTFADNSIGKVPIGKNPIGSITDSVQNSPKFRHIFTAAPINFYEGQFFFQSNDVDQSWSLLAFGPDARMSDDQNSDIKT